MIVQVLRDKLIIYDGDENIFPENEAMLFDGAQGMDLCVAPRFTAPK